MIDIAKYAGENSADRVSKGQLLIVDDVPNNLILLSAILTGRGYQIKTATDGVTALSISRAIMPDLILLDIMMPEMSGYSVCHQLKSDPHTESIPIVFLSALDDVSDKVKGFKVGGVDYITKPFEAAEVIVRVENQLTICRLQRQLQKQNQQLQQLNEELVRSNRDLEEFASVVSHDLQQPLQSVVGYAQLVSLKSQGQLDEEVGNYLNSITAAGHRMQQLIKDVLEYARVGAQSQSLSLTDCNLAVDQALENLHVFVNDHSATIRRTELPTIEGNLSQLTQLFQNLIANAIKFARPGVAPEVKISAELLDNQWRFEVRDNGIGIAAENVDRIFKIFARLHGSDNYTGNGIGLATCKKIVEAHQGKIWVESQLNEGTSFYFSLPAIAPERSIN